MNAYEKVQEVNKKEEICYEIDLSKCILDSWELSIIRIKHIIYFDFKNDNNGPSRAQRCR